MVGMSGNIGERFGSGGRKPAQLAALQQPGIGGARQHHLGLAGHRRHPGRRAAAIRHVKQVDAGALLEHLDAELVLAAVAARGVGQRRLLLARVFDQLRHVLAGTLGLTERKNWFDATLATGSRSLSMSIGIEA